MLIMNENEQIKTDTPSFTRASKSKSLQELIKASTHKRIVVQEGGLNWDFFEFLSSPYPRLVLPNLQIRNLVTRAR